MVCRENLISTHASEREEFKILDVSRERLELRSPSENLNPIRPLVCVRP